MTDNNTNVLPEKTGAAPPPKQRPPWWNRLVLRPLLFFGAGLLVIVALGAAQKIGWISAGGSDGQQHAAPPAGAEVRYVCPMMCIPPQTEPGRCPVCGMELVPMASGGSGADRRSIHIDPVARRVANIETVAVRAAPLVRKVRTVGRLSYDEGMLKTIAAYVDGRLERLYADYTGAVVGKGDRLALLYSPELYSAQVELLVAKEAREQARNTGRQGLTYNRHDLYDSARQRLVEYGMTEEQLAELEKTRRADSRIPIAAPIGGTVIEKLAVEGQYVKTGEPIYRLADLSAVWLMLELFPEDAAGIRYGQEVEAEVQSLPGRKFTGRVAFIAPTVEPKTRTVAVRVVVPNDGGLLRVGDYAKATVSVHLGGSGRPLAKFGFTDEPAAEDRALLVPRDAVLWVGEHGVVYVETEPGRFTLRRVVLGPASGDEIAVLDGLREGEQVARSGNFLIDSQMQLAGNPSLIDPTKATPKAEVRPPQPANAEAEAVAAALAGLPAADRALAEKQRICPVAGTPLGSMGPPVKVDVAGRPVFVCCEGCREPLLADPDEHLAKLKQEAGP